MSMLSALTAVETTLKVVTFKVVMTEKEMEATVVMTAALVVGTTATAGMATKEMNQEGEPKKEMKGKAW